MSIHQQASATTLPDRVEGRVLDEAPPRRALGLGAAIVLGISSTAPAYAPAAGQTLRTGDDDELLGEPAVDR